MAAGNDQKKNSKKTADLMNPDGDDDDWFDVLGTTLFQSILNNPKSKFILQIVLFWIGYFILFYY